MDLFYGVLIDLLIRDLTPELISLAERESLYPVEEEDTALKKIKIYIKCKKAFVIRHLQ